MNCSDSRRLLRLVKRLWRELRGGGGGGGGVRAPANASQAADADAGEDDAYLYILLIMIFYGCLAGGLILAYTRSRKLESKQDPYHLYIERDWASAAASGGGPARAADLRGSGSEEGAAAAAAELRGERRGSGDSLHP